MLPLSSWKVPCCRRGGVVVGMRRVPVELLLRERGQPRRIQLQLQRRIYSGFGSNHLYSMPARLQGLARKRILHSVSDRQRDNRDWTTRLILVLLFCRVNVNPLFAHAPSMSGPDTVMVLPGIMVT